MSHFRSIWLTARTNNIIKGKSLLFTGIALCSQCFKSLLTKISFYSLCTVTFPLVLLWSARAVERQSVEGWIFIGIASSSQCSSSTSAFSLTFVFAKPALLFKRIVSSCWYCCDQRWGRLRGSVGGWIFMGSVGGWSGDKEFWEETGGRLSNFPTAADHRWKKQKMRLPYFEGKSGGKVKNHTITN